MPFFIYGIRRPIDPSNWFKIGVTGHLGNRRSEYLVGCVPIPGHEHEYVSIWETTAKDELEARTYEHAVHVHFDAFRGKPCSGNRKSTEWFCIPDFSCVDAFISTQSWFKTRQSLDPRTWPQERMNKIEVPPNTKFISDHLERTLRLNEFQAPIIEKIKCFLQSPKEQAAHIVAACGSGKTRMTMEALRAVRPKRIVVVCPSLLIVGQWRRYLSEIFPHRKLFEDGTYPTLSLSKWVILTTNQSSSKLISLFSGPAQVPDIVVFDEVHHMAGQVAESETGYGETRRFIQFLITKCPNTKRFGLTYTPRTARSCDGTVVLSMDDEAHFGPCIARITYRQLVSLCILPDYRIKIIHNVDTNIQRSTWTNAICIKEAWSQSDQHGRPLSSHLLALCESIEEMKNLTEALREIIRDTWIHYLSSSSPEPGRLLSEFEQQPFAILVSCKMLNEGVDIPRADAVALMYPKRAWGDITQTLLRPGRWAPDKPIFHIWLMEDAASESTQNVLLALAEYDQVLQDLLTCRSVRDETAAMYGENLSIVGKLDKDEISEVFITSSDSDRASLIRLFNALLKKRFHFIRPAVLREIRAAKLRNADEYHTKRKYHWPEKPEGWWPEFNNAGPFNWTKFLGTEKKLL